jgi:hypothetical protein
MLRLGAALRCFFSIVRAGPAKANGPKVPGLAAYNPEFWKVIH